MRFKEPSSDSNDAISRVIDRSRLIRAVDALFAGCAVAWEHSRARRMAVAVGKAVESLPVAERVQLAGKMLAAATIAHAALSLAVGRAVARSTVGFWVLFVLLAVVMMTSGRQVAAAWHRSWARRASRFKDR
jgi:hypothetical protein